MYTNAGNLRRHKRFHTGETPYACQKCDARYRDLSSLKLHELKHTGNYAIYINPCPAGLIYCPLHFHASLKTNQMSWKFCKYFVVDVQLLK